jgi:hypothetical protein
LEILERSPDTIWFYRFWNEQGDFIKVDLPRPKFFNTLAKKWKVTEEETVALRWEKVHWYLKEDTSPAKPAWSSAPTNTTPWVASSIACCTLGR